MPASRLNWQNPKLRAAFWQVVLLSALLWGAAVIVNNTLDNLSRQGIASGFAFLGRTAGFDVSFSLIPYTEESTYGRVLVVAILNTLLVSAMGVVAATVLGFIIGIGRLSHNYLVGKLAGFYVEVVRNVPLLLQVFFWYFAVLHNLPSPRASYTLAGKFFLNIRGFYLPRLIHDASGWHWQIPELQGFNFQGGWVLPPELVALFLALTIYTAAFVAEIVRAGIQSVNPGQIEAASALGLSRRQTLRLILIPQAMRVIIPPLTSQYLNLTKNSSLAAAIAYPDVVLVFAGTVLMQTGQAVEVIGITMLFYLTISLLISWLMNWYNKRTLLYTQR